MDISIESEIIRVIDIEMKGLSLLEVMVATMILAGTLLSITRIISSSYLYTERISNLYLGSELAQLKLHEIQEKIYVEK